MICRSYPGPWLLEGATLNNLGIAYAELENIDKATGYYEQRLVISVEIGDRRGEGVALGNLGETYANLGEVEKAIPLLEQALEIGGRSRIHGSLTSPLSNSKSCRGAPEDTEALRALSVG